MSVDHMNENNVTLKTLPVRLNTLKLSSVQLLSHARFFATPCTATRQASLSITNSWSLRKLASIELVMPSNHLILCHPPQTIKQLSLPYIKKIKTELKDTCRKQKTIKGNTSVLEKKIKIELLVNESSLLHNSRVLRRSNMKKSIKAIYIYV